MASSHLPHFSYIVKHTKTKDCFGNTYLRKMPPQTSVYKSLAILIHVLFYKGMCMQHDAFTRTFFFSVFFCQMLWYMYIKRWSRGGAQISNCIDIIIPRV